MQALPKGFCQSVKAREESFQYPKAMEDAKMFTLDGAYSFPAKVRVIEFEGKGKVVVGASPEWGAFYNQVEVTVTLSEGAEADLKSLVLMSQAAGLPPVFVQSRKEDKQRRALLEVFRAHFPGEAMIMERDASNFLLSPEELRQKLIELNEAVEPLLEEFLTEDLLAKEVMELAAHEIVNRVGLADAMRREGALGLMMGSSASFSVLSLMLKEGPVSSQIRFSKGIFAKGVSSYEDHKGCGAEGVFTRLITEELMKEHTIGDFAYSGKFQLLIGLEAADRANSYGFESDNYGDRKGGRYAQRLSLIQLSKKMNQPAVSFMVNPLRETPKLFTANEVILRHQIPPRFIKGVVVQSEEQKSSLIEQLQMDGLITIKNKMGFINGKPVDDFIHVSTSFSKEMWNDG